MNQSLTALMPLAVFSTQMMPAYTADPSIIQLNAENICLNQGFFSCFLSILGLRQ